MKQHTSSNGVSRVIGSPLAGLFFLGLALYAQTPHTQNAFFELGHDKVGGFALYNSWAYAIALELAVLYFVVRGYSQPAYIFAGVSVAMNVAYYTIHQNDMTNIAQNWPNWLISVSLPVAIAYYSHCIAGADSPSIRAWAIAQWHKLRMRIDELRNRWPSQFVQPNDAQPETPAQTEDAQPPVAEKVIRAKRLKSEGLTNVQIAAELGVHRNSVPKLLNGHSKEAM